MNPETIETKVCEHRWDTDSFDVLLCKECFCVRMRGHSRRETAIDDVSDEPEGYEEPLQDERPKPTVEYLQQATFLTRRLLQSTRGGFKVARKAAAKLSDFLEAARVEIDDYGRIVVTAEILEDLPVALLHAASCVYIDAGNGVEVVWKHKG